jgi:phage gpG-like protein
MIVMSRFKWLGKDTVAEEEFAKLRPSAEKAVFRAALYFEGAVKRKLSGARTGRIYRIGRKGRVHQASAPGEAPASLTGKLRQSITHTDPQWVGDNVFVEVGTSLPYAAILEYGGVSWNGGRILPRPYMASTYLEEAEALDAILEGATKTK